MSRRENDTWEIIGAFVVACALLTALVLAHAAALDAKP
jgi:hypothetical protein